MPYKSQAQRRYFNANRQKLEAKGVNVQEFNQASEGRKLPARAHKKSSQANHERKRIALGKALAKVL